MNDENPDEQPRPHLFQAFMPQPTPEQLAAMEHAQAEMYANRHDFVKWLTEEVNIPELKMLRIMLRNIIESEDAAHFFMGLVSTRLHQAGLCMACGENHDEELARMAAPGPEDQVYEFGDEKWTTLAIEYGVEPTGVAEQVRCSNCGQQYVSLEDRMLRKAGKEGCNGCIEKEKWG